MARARVGVVVEITTEDTLGPRKVVPLVQALKAPPAGVVNAKAVEVAFAYCAHAFGTNGSRTTTQGFSFAGERISVPTQAGHQMLTDMQWAFHCPLPNTHASLSALPSRSQ